jgi:hypothetical protein
MSPTLTDAAVHRMIRRVLAHPATCSDTILVLADGLTEAAAWTRSMPTADALRGHAEHLRALAHCFADREVDAPAPAPDPALALVTKHGVTVHQIIQRQFGLSLKSPMHALLAELLRACPVPTEGEAP